MKETSNRTGKGSGFRSAVIFGGAGFVGSNWARYLLRETDAKIHVFDSLARPGARHNLAALQKEAESSGRLQITVGDVRNAEMVERAVRPATEIYHFAAQVAVTTSVLDPRLDFEVNLAGSFNILEAARKSARRPFLLFTSTNKVYGDLAALPLKLTESRYQYAGTTGITEEQALDFYSPYGCSKGAADQYVRDYGRTFDLPAVVLRMSCIAGPHQFGTEDQGWVAHFLYSALARRPVVIYGDGRQVRDVLYVGDLLRAIEAVRQALPQSQGEVYNVGGGPENAVSLLEVADLIQELTGQRLQCVHDSRRIGDQRIYVTDFTKLRRHTGWQPTVSVRETLEKMWTWWRRNRELFVTEREERAPRAALSLEQLPGAAA